MSSGAEIRPLSQWDLGDFLSNLKKNSQSQKKEKKFFFFFLNFHSVTTHTHTHTHKLHNDNLLEMHPIFLQFNGNCMCNSKFCFLTDQKCCSCLFRKFPKIVVYRANFPNLKGPRAPSQNCKKNPCTPICDILLSKCERIMMPDLCHTNICTSLEPSAHVS